MSDDEEIFEPSIPVSPHERGESFGMTAGCYRRMAQAALRCKEYGGIEPTTIRRLPSGPGCQLTLYGRENRYVLRVFADTTPARLYLCYLPLDSKLSGPGCELAVLYDEWSSWLHIADMMIFREGAAGSEELVEWQEISEHLRENNDWWWKT